MSNRIDLTQFNGYTKPDEKLFLEEMQEAFERAVVLDETVSCVDANLALFAPYLLTELKRCYEKMDALTTALETIAGDLVYASSGDAIAKIAEYADEMSSLI